MRLNFSALTVGILCHWYIIPLLIAILILRTQISFANLKQFIYIVQYVFVCYISD